MRPREYSRWREDSGAAVVVLMLTNVGSNREDFPETVVYESLDSGKRYSRPLSEWIEPGKYVPL